MNQFISILFLTDSKKRISQKKQLQFYSGILNEIFLCLWYKDIKIVIGAFRINNVTRADFSHVYNNMDDENKKICQKPSVGNIMKRFRYIRWGISEII